MKIQLKEEMGRGRQKKSYDTKKNGKRKQRKVESEGY